MAMENRDGWLKRFMLPSRAILKFNWCLGTAPVPLGISLPKYTTPATVSGRKQIGWDFWKYGGMLVT